MEQRRARGQIWRVVLASAAVIALVALMAWLLGADREKATSGPAAGPGVPSSSASASAGSSYGPTSTPSAEASTPTRSSSAKPSATRTSSPGKERTPTSLVTVPVRPLTTKPPVELTETADFGTGLTVEVVEMRAVTGQARVPGEIAGPALWVNVRARNDTDDSISLATVDVQVTYGPNRVPGVPLGAPDVSPFPDSLAPGAVASASYVYGVPADQRDQVQVVVFYSTDAPLVVFEGAAP